MPDLELSELYVTTAGASSLHGEGEVPAREPVFLQVEVRNGCASSTGPLTVEPRIDGVPAPPTSLDPLEPGETRWLTVECHPLEPGEHAFALVVRTDDGGLEPASIDDVVLVAAPVL